MILGIGLFGSLIPRAQAQPLTINPQQSQQSLDSHFAIFKDPSAKLSLHDVMAQPQRFKPSSGRNSLHIGYTQDTIWLKIILQSRQSLEHVLMFQYPYLDRIDLYEVVNHHLVKHQYSGFSVPPAQRALDDIHPAFLLNIPANQPVTLYLKAQATGSMTLDASMYSIDEFHRVSNQTLFFQLVFMGMAIALALYNFFLGTVLRQRVFLLYCGFISCFAIATMTATGVGGLYAWPLLGPVINYVVPCGYSIAVVWAVIFARYFLSLTNTAPRVDKVHQVMIVITAIMAGSTLFLPAQFGVKIMSLLGCSMAAFLAFCGFVGIHNKVPAARYYLLAWACLLLGSVLVSLRNTGLIASNFITVYGMEIGSAMEMLLLSFALAARFNELKRQKEFAQNKLLKALTAQEKLLEQRVSERTHELKLAKESLESMASHDSLTQIFNRLGLSNSYQRLKQEMPEETTQAIFLIDLDGFKPVNDQYGHAAGDVLLQTIAKRLKSICRPTDIVARLGGDEFVVLCLNIDKQDILLEFAKRLLRQIIAPIHLDCNIETKVGASIGVCLSSFKQHSFEQQLHLADQAMYHIKTYRNVDIAQKIAIDDQLTHRFLTLNHLSRTPADLITG
ncbi:diguanylate cyclase (GGDEF)-like protein [Celerinatantimonas diazotrophica]|uniref:Diguanylate cyclase (GGDEF)-like protein n=2 Tax=Celerinatantimonas diazotrophica TaxID=412034 RepID=A0A4R1JBD6_9GAMM|nr:diguanylate cyclase (GGDEF)-like protein [Celerinatantimonas diazotrophica]CAG9294921.1 hypothetical protein CEDIAZO_00027 [Celerinatantimonas diazotrophica]